MKIWIVVIATLCCINSLESQSQDKRLYMFGHSLMDHRPPANPTPSDETTIAHWMNLLAQEAGHNFSAGGQYGFLLSHINLPPNAQWGYDLVPGSWDQDNETFAEANLYDVFITAGNFIQYQAPHLPYESDNNPENISPVSATETIVDWLMTQEDDSMVIYLYENWPEMNGFLNNGWPASQQELDNYHINLRGEFHDWWLDYHDVLLISRPASDIRLIPVGPIIADLMDGILNAVPIAEWYEDGDPHGRPNIYFLAGLISYMGVYGEPAPSSFTVPSTCSSIIANNYQAVVDFIWQELSTFVDNNGINRVFGTAGPPPPTIVKVEGGPLFIDNYAGIILKGRDELCYNIYVDDMGNLQHEEVECPN